MRDAYLNITLEDSAPLFILHLEGYLAQLNVYKLKNQMERIYQQGGRFILVDMRELVFVDSAGLGVMMQVRTELTRLAGGLGIVHSESPQVRSSLISSQLIKVIPFYEDVTSARQAFGEKYHLRQKPPAAPAPAASEAAVIASADSGLTNAALLRRIELLEIRLGKLERYLSTSTGSA